MIAYLAIGTATYLVLAASSYAGSRRDKDTPEAESARAGAVITTSLSRPVLPHSNSSTRQSRTPSSASRQPAPKHGTAGLSIGEQRRTGRQARKEVFARPSQLPTAEAGRTPSNTRIAALLCCNCYFLPAATPDTTQLLPPRVWSESVAKQANRQKSSALGRRRSCGTGSKRPPLPVTRNKAASSRQQEYPGRLAASPAHHESLLDRRWQTREPSVLDWPANPAAGQVRRLDWKAPSALRVDPRFTERDISHSGQAADPQP